MISSREYVTLYGKWDLANVIRSPEVGWLSELSIWMGLISYKGSYNKRGGMEN